jgi:1-acyl-sn-glycerol-3-phosphate acyltransferase
MKYIISIYLWTVGLMGFAIIIILAILLTYLLPVKKYDPLIKRMLRLFLKILWVKVDVEMIKTLDKNKTYLFMANHVSMFDIPVLGGYVPNICRGVEASRQFVWPIYGFAVRRIGNIPIDRHNIHRSIRSINNVKNTLDRGISIIILPEGHRTLDGKLRNFKKLPFLLAKQVGQDIVPIGLSGMFRLKPKTSWIISPTRVKIKFGEIITAEQINAMSVLELRDYTRCKIEGLIEYP